MNDPIERPRSRKTIYWLTVVVVAAATFGVVLLYGSITNRKIEARETGFELVRLDETTVDPREWGKNFPRQHDGYLRTVDVVRTKHGGSEAFQKLDEDPAWRTIFAGYAFSLDYREERGHAYMLRDQRETDRVTQRKQPGACMQCHAAVLPAYRKIGLEKGAQGSAADPLDSPAGQEQVQRGFEAMCAMPFEQAATLVAHPVTCLDCHDPETMLLRVTRPAFVTAIQALARSADPLPHLPSVERWRQGTRAKPYAPNADASRQEMRSLACAQCHVEYFFAPDTKLVVYPWHNGLKVEQIEAHYDAAKFSDWTHAVTKAPVLKAQHPEFELWSQGIHARSGVACADCHMPYVRQGAIKISDHHVRSPLLNTARACQTCHNYSQAEIEGRATAIQDRTKSLLDRGEQALVELIAAIDAAAKNGVSDERLERARGLQRKAQFRLDFVAAENSMGFHAPQEAARILGEAIDFARQGQIAAIHAGR